MAPPTLQEAFATFKEYAGAFAALANNAKDDVTGNLAEPTKDLIKGYNDYLQKTVEEANKVAGPVEVLSYDKWLADTPEGQKLDSRVDDAEKAKAKDYIANSEAGKKVTSLAGKLMSGGRDVFEVMASAAGKVQEGAGGIMESIGAFFKDNQMGVIGAVIAGVVGLFAGLNPILLLLGALLIGGMMGAFNDKEGMFSGMMGHTAPPKPNEPTYKPRSASIDVKRDEKPLAVKMVDGKKQAVTKVAKDGQAAEYGDTPQEVQYEQKQTVPLPDGKKREVTVITRGKVNPEMTGFKVSGVSILMENGDELAVAPANIPTDPITLEQGRLNLQSDVLGLARQDLTEKMAAYLRPKPIKLVSGSGIETFLPLGKTKDGHTITLHGQTAGKDKASFRWAVMTDDAGNVVGKVAVRENTNPAHAKYNAPKEFKVEDNNTIILPDGERKHMAERYAAAITAPPELKIKSVTQIAKDGRTLIDVELSVKKGGEEYTRTLLGVGVDKDFSITDYKVNNDAKEHPLALRDIRSMRDVVGANRADTQALLEKHLADHPDAFWKAIDTIENTARAKGEALNLVNNSRSPEPAYDADAAMEKFKNINVTYSDTKIDSVPVIPGASKPKEVGMKFPGMA